MKINIGNDIIEVERIKKLLNKYGKNFQNKVYTKKEIEYCESKKSHKFESYAGRFAGKEAVFKAISGYLDNKYQIGWKDIEILNDKNGRPFVNLKFEKIDYKNSVENYKINEKNEKDLIKKDKKNENKYLESENKRKIGNLNNINKIKFDISISHIEKNAIATVIAYQD